ncbi:aspartate/glutamate racemase family protein [uncultured Tateyamaria sp.]|uniref:maleate cis-trans isomerase family protein n=1 Tax=uncultured Tateyamaria sp. TaxID=455651 RepID=UPI00262530B6|nr:aspartate/glutamate racemase family protein [uncultured Tateyamaria sp.]
MVYAYTRAPEEQPKLGLIALQADRTMEDDFRRMMPADVSLLVSRVPSGLEVTPESLAEMEGHLSASAALFPEGHGFDVIGYGCTSATAQIGAAAVADQVRKGAETAHVTDPVTALIAACAAARARRIAILSPYVASVSDRLRDVLAAAGIDTPTFGSFDEANEAAVAGIDAASITEATLDMMQGAQVDAVFLSCTNLRTLDVIGPLQARLGVPVMSSNLVLAWHMLHLAWQGPGQPGGLLGLK